MAKYKYSIKVTQSLKHDLRSDILKATKEHPDLNKEIDRVFHMANRRIQNLKKSKGDLISPAYVAIKGLEGKTSNEFNIFNTSGKNWFEKRMLYAKAIEFLRNPTSLATGAKQFTRQFRKEIGIKDNKQWELYKDRFNEHYAGKEGSIRANAPYEKIMQKMYDRKVQTISKQIESDAERRVKRIEKEVNTFATESAEEIEKYLQQSMTAFKITNKNKS